MTPRLLLAKYPLCGGNDVGLASFALTVMSISLPAINRVACFAVALAFRAQMVEQVPMADNDRGVDVIVIQDGAIAVSARGANAMG